MKTEEDYQKGLIRFLEICDCPANDDEVKELFLLMQMMEKYERENCSVN